MAGYRKSANRIQFFLTGLSALRYAPCMTSYFWAEETEIPAGNGYELLGAAHLTVLLLFVILIVVSICLFRRSSESRKNLVLRTVALMLPALETLKICFLIRIGHMGVGYLPLHLCSMSIFLYPVIAFSDNRLPGKVLSEISCCTLLPAAVSALVFPDWTIYPMFSFMNIYAYLWHTLQVIFPVMCICLGIAVPDIRHIWWNTAFLLVVGIPVYIFDRVCNCNYWFLRWPVPGTPLVAMSEMLDEKVYIPALLLVATIVNLLMILIFRVIRYEH